MPPSPVAKRSTCRHSTRAGSRSTPSRHGRPRCRRLRASRACAAAWAASDIAPFALFEGVLLVGALLALSLYRPEALGMGDVKLALLLVPGLDGRAVVALLVALALAAGFGLLLVARFGRAAA